MTEPTLRWAFFWRLTGVTLCAAVFVMALTPVAVRAPILISDKLIHAVVFLALTVWFSAVVPRGKLNWLALIMLGFGIVIELAQLTVSYRRAEFADLVADAVGIGLGLVVAMLGARHWARALESLTRAVLPR